MIWKVAPLFFLAAYTAPYLVLAGRFGLSLHVDDYTWWVFQFTVGQALASAAASLAVGVLLVPAYVRAPLVKSLALIPFFAPALSTVDALTRLHGDVMYGPWGIVIAHAVYYAPYVALVVESNLKSIPADLADALRVYRPGLWVRAKFYLSELRPSLYYSFYTVFIFSFLSFTTPLLLGGRYPTMELLIYIYATAFTSAEYVSSLLALMLVSSAALALPLFKLPQLPPAAPAPAAVKFGRLYTAASVAAAAYFAVVAFYIFTPLAAPRGLAEAAPLLLNSVLVAVVASVFSLGVVLAFLVSHAAGSQTPLAAYFVALSLSKSLFALGFFYLAQPLYGTLAILAAAHVFALAPLSYSIVKPAWDKLRQDSRESCVAYLGPARCVSRVASEMLGPTLVQTWLLSMASSLSETTMALILTTGGATTLSAEAARLLSSRAPDFIETGHFYSALLAAVVLATLASSRLVKTRPYSF